MTPQSKSKMTRINNRFPVAREGIPFIFIGGLITLVGYLFGLRVLPGVTALFTLFSLYFFRDPERHRRTDQKEVLAPADGKVIKIQSFEDDHNLLGEPAVKVSIFMSVFNVHVNRNPVSGKVIAIRYHPGRFLSANLDKSSTENENNAITLETSDGKRLVNVQIAGLIARRIACWIEEKDHVVAGDRFGLIRFGSRLDVYLPLDSQINVRHRQKVRAGLTTLGYLP